MVGGSFALDMQSLEIGATVGGLTYLLYLPCSKAQPASIKQEHQHLS